jgi:hypothetical protein
MVAGILESSVQYEMTGYLGMAMCVIYFALCTYILWEISDRKLLAHSGKTTQKVIIVLLSFFNALDFPQYQVPPPLFFL